MGKRAPKNQGDPAVVVGYIRVSTTEQKLGPEAQRRELERWCQAHGARLAAVHEDHGVQGAADLDRRPGLQEALDALTEHGAGVLLVAKRDRLARDVVLAAMIERLAERQGGRVLTADGTGNGSGPEAQLMRGMVDLFAQYERAIIRARIRAALAVKKRRGELIGSVPYGCRLGSDGRTLMPDPGEQRVVEVVRAGRARGLTLRAIGAELDSLELRPRTGGAWHPTTINRIADAA